MFHIYSTFLNKDQGNHHSILYTYSYSFCKTKKLYFLWPLVNEATIFKIDFGALCMVTQVFSWQVDYEFVFGPLNAEGFRVLLDRRALFPLY